MKKLNFILSIIAILFLLPAPVFASPTAAPGILWLFIPAVLLFILAPFIYIFIFTQFLSLVSDFNKYFLASIGGVITSLLYYLVLFSQGDLAPTERSSWVFFLPIILVVISFFIFKGKGNNYGVKLILPTLLGLLILILLVVLYYFFLHSLFFKLTGDCHFHLRGLDTEERQSCFTQSALKNNDRNICFQSSSPMTCLYTYDLESLIKKAKEAQDVSLCGQMDPDMGQDQSTNELISRCKIALIDLDKTGKSCLLISHGAINGFGDRIGQCLSNVGHLELCATLNNLYGQQEDCVVAGSRKEEDIFYCNNIDTPDSCRELIKKKFLNFRQK